MAQVSSNSSQGPSPELLFRTATAFQQSAALKAAVDLNLFTVIGEGKTAAKEISQACAASERGVRILCDYLCVLGFLTKESGKYGLTQDSAVFLNRHSPAYMGGTLEFLQSAHLREGTEDLTNLVKRGGNHKPDGAAMATENPSWVKFARAMAPMMHMPAQMIAKVVNGSSTAPLKVLDLAAGHGLFGIAFAQSNPKATVVAQDWANVLEVAKENAKAAGVADRISLLPGDAFNVEFGSGFDVILLTNFLHHFDVPTCEKLLRKVHAALAPNGRAVTLEFIPNPDRISPPVAATFSLTMLTSTAGGDAYTFEELKSQHLNAGFARVELHSLGPSPQGLVIGYR